MTQLRIPALLPLTLALAACGGGGGGAALEAGTSAGTGESLAIQAARQCELYPAQAGCLAAAAAPGSTSDRASASDAATASASAAAPAGAANANAVVPAPAPVPAPAAVAAVPADSAPSSAPAPAPAPAAAPAPVVAAAGAAITMASWPGTLLQTGFGNAAYWIEDGAWGAGALTRGTYTGLAGTQYEQTTGVGSALGPNGEVSARMAWKWPTGTTEVKAYPSVLVGNKPGYQNSWITPGGNDVRLPDGSTSQAFPSGKTPGSFFPVQLPLPPIYSSFSYQHNAAPSGRGHLSYDIWLQNTPEQSHGFAAPPITHEIMIPLDYWGGYGAHGNRNPGWYDSDVTIDGRRWHIYISKNADGTFTPNFFGGWKLIVFEPDGPVAPGTINLSSFLNYLATRKDSAGTPWANGNEHLVSVELGVEPVEGTGDLTISNYRVWK